jgi:TetR/AcrR family transcriptional regulator, transcriptional repressor for nem operon
MARHKEFNRDKALDSALATFRKNGFGATTTDDLRLAMGIGRQSFYDTFKGKRETYLEALRKYNSDRVHGYFEIFRQSGSPLKALEGMLTSISVESPKDRALSCLGVSSICEFGSSDAEISSINGAAASSIKSVLEKLILEAKNKKEIRSSLDPKKTAFYLLSVFSGMRVSARAGASPEELNAIAAIAIDGLRKQ